MDNLQKIPDEILSSKVKELIIRLADENTKVIQPNKGDIIIFAAIDRLAGAYIDCLADRDEWKKFGESIQKATKTYGPR